jgi:ASC-1-like (ASCH) protein
MNARVYNRSEVLKGIIMKRHVMNLTPAPLRMIREGRKTIELRLYDEKRQQVKAGDTILFTNTATDETLHTTVLKLHRFDSFNELYQYPDSSKAKAY